MQDLGATVLEVIGDIAQHIRERDLRALLRVALPGILYLAEEDIALPVQYITDQASLMAMVHYYVVHHRSSEGAFILAMLLPEIFDLVLF